MVSYDELLNAPITDLPTKTLIDAWYDGTKHMCHFSREVMLPMLKQLLKPSTQERAVRDTFYRLCLFLRSIVELNKLDHFQSVASAARSIFELWIDLELLAQDTSGEAVRQYDAFAELERYRRAEQIVRFADAHPNAIAMDISRQRSFCTDPERQRRLASEWGTNRAGKQNFPDHWSRETLRDRSRRVGQEAMYIEAQPLLSWYVHSGGAGISGMSRDALEAVFALSHILTQRFFVAATSTCARITTIAELPDFPSWKQQLRLKTGELILAEEMRRLQDQQERSRSQN